MASSEEGPHSLRWAGGTSLRHCAQCSAGAEGPKASRCWRFRKLCMSGLRAVLQAGEARCVQSSDSGQVLAAAQSCCPGGCQACSCRLDRLGCRLYSYCSSRNLGYQEAERGHDSRVWTDAAGCDSSQLPQAEDLVALAADHCRIVVRAGCLKHCRFPKRSQTLVGSCWWA